MTMSGYKTLIGAGLALLTSLLPIFGYHVSDLFLTEANEIVDQIIVVLSSAFAIYGRLVAKVPGWLVK